MTSGYELGLARPARRAIADRLPPDVASAVVEFVTGPLLEAPLRVGKPLRNELAGAYSTRLGREWPVLYEIDRSTRTVIVLEIQHRSAADRQR